MARKRRKKRLRLMAKFPFVKFGSPAGAHRKRLGNDVRAIDLYSGRTAQLAAAGQCKRAYEYLTDAAVAYGQAGAENRAVEGQFPNATSNAFFSGLRAFKNYCVK